MADAKSLFDDLKKRLEPKAYRWHKPAAPDTVPVPETAPIAAALASSPASRPAQDRAQNSDHAAENLPNSTRSAPETAVVPDPSGTDVLNITGLLSPAPAETAAVSPADETAEVTLAGEVEQALDEMAGQMAETAADVPPNQVFETMSQDIQSLVDEIEARTSGAAEVARIRDQLPGAGVASGGNLLADVRAIAAGWFRNGRASDAVNRGPGDVAMPEELIAAAADRGVDVSYAERKLSSLGEKDFPCIALDRQGGSHILLGRPDKGTFMMQDGDRTTLIPLRRLKQIASGVLFFVRPKAVPAADIAPAAAVETAAASTAPASVSTFKIFGTVASEMFSTQRPLLWQLALATVLSNIFTFALPLFSMAVYDRVVPHLAWETLWALSIGVVIILLADFILRYIRMKLLDSVGLTTSSALQSRLFSRIVHGKMKDVPSLTGGVTTGMREVEALCHVVPSLLIAIAVDMPFFIAATALIYSIAGYVAVTPLIGALVLAAIHIISHLGEDAARNHSRYVGTQTNALMETMGALETVKLTGAERMLLRRWERLVDAASYASHLNRLQGNFSGQASVVVSQAVTVLAMVIGVYEISTGAMTIGAMSAAVLLIGRMMTPVSQLMGLLHRSHQLTSSARMMERVFNTPQEVAGDSSETRAETPIKGHLSFRNVSFTYPGEQTPCLEGISLDIRPGEKIGLIGRVGSGKSTLLRLMLRLHDPSTGSMLVDGQDVRQISPRALRRIAGFMRQDSVLFDDTLQANLTFGLEMMKAADFERAVALTGVKDFAARNAQGYGMRVGTRGERLSGGERQSVAMARVLVENPPILVFDEPTSAMDNALEAKIVRELRDVIASKTLIVATHRAPLLGLVDRIIWMEGGKIVADGPKAEVLQRLSTQAAA